MLEFALGALVMLVGVVMGGAVSNMNTKRDRGPQGIQGPKGDDGPQGPQGLKGDIGGPLG